MTTKEILSDHRHLAVHIRKTYDENRFKNVLGVDNIIAEEIIKLARAVENSDQRHNLRRGIGEIMKIRK